MKSVNEENKIIRSFYEFVENESESLKAEII